MWCIELIWWCTSAGWPGFKPSDVRSSRSRKLDAVSARSVASSSELSAGFSDTPIADDEDDEQVLPRWPKRSTSTSPVSPKTSTRLNLFFFKTKGLRPPSSNDGHFQVVTSRQLIKQLSAVHGGAIFFPLFTFNSLNRLIFIIGQHVCCRVKDFNTGKIKKHGRRTATKRLAPAVG